MQGGSVSVLSWRTRRKLRQPSVKTSHVSTAPLTCSLTPQAAVQHWLSAVGKSAVLIPTGKGKRFIPSPKRPDRLCYPPDLLFSGYRGLTFATHLHLAPRLTVSGAVPPQPVFAFKTQTGTNLLLYLLVHAVGRSEKSGHNKYTSFQTVRCHDPKTCDDTP
jgi:hypothetical protein